MDAEYGKDALPGDFLKYMFVILYVYLLFFIKGTTIALTLYFSWTVEVSSIFFRF